MFDPFTASDPPVLVHEVEGWQCPVCGQGKQRDRGVSEHNQRPWIRYSCGDVVAQEITAG